MSFLYQRIDKEDPESTYGLLDQRKEGRQPDRWWYPSWANIMLAALLVVSALQQIIQDSELRQLRQARLSSLSFNAGLERDTFIAWSPEGRWVNDDDQVLEDQIWNSPDLDFSKGVVALDDRWAVDHNISLAQRWPWDEHKGIYLLSSTHDVHCIKSIRRALLNAYDGKPFGLSRGHAKHCLSILMQDALCSADDLLLYTGAVYENRLREVPSAGAGQFRQCRDWGKLRAWAEENSACYNRSSVPGAPLSEYYKGCPDGSTPWLSMNQDG